MAVSKFFSLPDKSLPSNLEPSPHVDSLITSAQTIKARRTLNAAAPEFVPSHSVYHVDHSATSSTSSPPSPGTSSPATSSPSSPHFHPSQRFDYSHSTSSSSDDNEDEKQQRQATFSAYHSSKHIFDSQLKSENYFDCLEVDVDSGLDHVDHDVKVYKLHVICEFFECFFFQYIFLFYCYSSI